MAIAGVRNHFDISKNAWSDHQALHLKNSSKITALVCSYLEDLSPTEMQEISYLENIFIHLQQPGLKEPSFPIKLNTPAFNAEPYFQGIEKCLTGGKFDTLLALQYFRKMSAEAYLKLSDRLTQPSQETLKKGSQFLHRSPERELILKIEIYFFLIGMLQKFHGIDSNIIEQRDKRLDDLRDEFLTLILGLDLFAKGDRSYRCEAYAFDVAEWSIGLADTIPSLPELSSFLEKKGYTRLKENQMPQVDDIIVYYRSGKTFFFEHVQHYGKVIRIEEGTPIIRSKLGLGDIYDHKEVIVYSFYGDSKTYFRLLLKS